MKNTAADVDLIDERFDVSQSESYHLSIQTEPGRLSYCVLDTAENKYVILRSYPLPVAEKLDVDACRLVFENDELLGVRYKSSSYLHVSPCYTFVPEQLFEPAQANTYLSFNQRIESGDAVQYQYVRSVGLYDVFSCPEEQMALLRTYQPLVHLFHHSAPFIHAVIAEAPFTDHPVVAVYFYHRWLDVMAISGKKLLFYNSFQVDAPADAVYYFAGVCNMLGVDPKQQAAKFMYAGNGGQMPPEAALVGNYVRFTDCESPVDAIYSQYITETLRRKFVHLFHLYKCGL